MYHNLSINSHEVNLLINYSILTPQPTDYSETNNMY